MALRILLADDHAGFRRTVSEFLARMPDINIVGEAADGKEAVEQVEKLHPDMVLIDISMPNQNGLEATRIIKERWPATRVVIATTHDSPVYRNKANEAHADGFILKSSLKPDLMAAIQQANNLTFYPHFTITKEQQ